MSELLDVPTNPEALILFKVYLEKEEDGLTTTSTEFAPAFTAEEIRKQVENIKEIIPATPDEEAAYRNGFHSGVEYGFSQGSSVFNHVTVMDNTTLEEEA